MSVQIHNLNNHHQDQAIWLDNFINIYSQLSVDNLHLLDRLYHQDIIFIDPMHSLQGLAQLNSYFSNLYSNLASCDFTIVQVIHEGNQAAIYWQMKFCHPRLNKGQEVEVSGSSHIQGDNDKVTYHRDYVDVGAMLYEHIPFIGKLIAFIKRRATKNV
ncbi:nuclear transport factor 2 family protein [Litorilituus lipolyticus]|uniref:Nuclear transport factor 2 family protein n=1 Tax=Litorilituus lipolyticus TaxID=2491017 RepID=A0A502KKY4_9GAMM|nr:nuclear transport factor 2 family protein [Litorilituus lipolyticus]TPH12086.1 nuclear transport factor 2 family protein [Litorilituus lipolyticus]